jgi:toluene monooxygenase system protein E
VSRLSLPLKTYSHLYGARRMPSDYELVSSRLLYHVGRGFEVDTPVRAWYDRYQAGSPLSCGDWEAFRDPRETTYASYVALQARKETHVAALLDALERDAFDETVEPAWRDRLERVLGPLRFPLHGLQMLAAYVGQMAPGGRLAIAAAFQAADELRRIHGIAHRLAQLRRRHPRAAAGSREAWQSEACWQPLRRAVETALVTYDWGESFTAVNVCTKPLVDALFVTELARTARAHQDYHLVEMLSSFDEDCRWQRDWTRALLVTAFTLRPANRDVVRGWVVRHLPAARDAVAAAAPLCGADDPAARDRLDEFTRAWLASCGLEVP